MTADDPPTTYRGQVAVLATKHGKQEQIAAPLRRVGIELVVADVDTDAFGTFTGEIARLGTPLEVAVRKARAAMRASSTRLGVASEGSFGPHPEVPFVTVDVEVVVLVDDVNGVVVAEQAVGVASVVARTVAPGQDTSDLWSAAGPPGQALICRPADGSRRHVTKGITTPPALDRAIRRAAAASTDDRAVVESDLRADRCPARREVIAATAEKLAARLACPCPHCGVPGYGATQRELGLRCGLCGHPTRLPAATVVTCLRCDHRERRAVCGTAEPAVCDRCNP